jgi:hypothetical protein
MANDTPQLRTAGVIAVELGAPLSRVLHILRTRRHIRPIGRAGTLRLYDRRAVAMIRHELNAIDARRCESIREEGPPCRD